MSDNKYSEDIKKFKEMTKPMKFRRIKMFFQSIGLTYEVGKERSKYLFNYLLYKLHIYKRYSYRDKVEKEFSLPNTIKPKGVSTQFLSALVDMKLVVETDIDLDYFYREKKDGSKKITLYMKNEEHHRVFTVSTLKNISLCIAGQFYHVDNLPVFKMASITPTPVKMHEPSELIKPVKYKTITYDVRRLKQLRYQNFIGVDMKPDYITEAMAKYYYDQAVREFREYLSDVTLESLILEVSE